RALRRERIFDGKPAKRTARAGRGFRPFAAMGTAGYRTPGTDQFLTTVELNFVVDSSVRSGPHQRAFFFRIKLEVLNFGCGDYARSQDLCFTQLRFMLNGVEERRCTCQTYSRKTESKCCTN